jgi:hypothetical protein
MLITCFIVIYIIVHYLKKMKYSRILYYILIKQVCKYDILNSQSIRALNVDGQGEGGSLEKVVDKIGKKHNHSN